jgi:excisionase family DNA binding protein
MQATEEADPLVGTEEIAAMLAVSEPTARRLMKSGDLGPMFDVALLGKPRYRVRRSTVEAWIKTRRVTA